MQGHEGILIRQAIFGRRHRRREKPDQRINHYVSDEVDFPDFHSFGLEVLISI